MRPPSVLGSPCQKLSMMRTSLSSDEKGWTTAPCRAIRAEEEVHGVEVVEVAVVDEEGEGVGIVTARPRPHPPTDVVGRVVAQVEGRLVGREQIRLLLPSHKCLYSKMVTREPILLPCRKPHGLILPKV